MLEYFKGNVKNIAYFLLSEVLINNKNYEKEVKEMIEESNEVSKKYKEKIKLSETILVGLRDIP